MAELQGALSSLPISDEQLKQINKSAQDSAKNTSGEIWIGAKDYLVYKIMISNTQAGNVTSMIEFKNYNESKNITAPESTKTIGQVIYLILTGPLGQGLAGFSKNLKIGGKQVISPASTDSDKDKLPDWLESIYGTNPKNPDSDNDGFRDGSEIKNGFNPLGPGKLDW